MNGRFNSNKHLKVRSDLNITTIKFKFVRNYEIEDRLEGYYFEECYVTFMNWYSDNKLKRLITAGIDGNNP